MHYHNACLLPTVQVRLHDEFFQCRDPFHYLKCAERLQAPVKLQNDQHIARTLVNQLVLMNVDHWYQKHKIQVLDQRKNHNQAHMPVLIVFLK